MPARGIYLLCTADADGRRFYAAVGAGLRGSGCAFTFFLLG
jgi:hypothetical protein